MTYKVSNQINYLKRVTVMVCTTMGGKNLPISLIVKSKKSHCFIFISNGNQKLFPITINKIPGLKINNFALVDEIVM